jgi:hypothetical protein
MFTAYPRDVQNRIAAYGQGPLFRTALALIFQLNRHDEIDQQSTKANPSLLVQSIAQTTYQQGSMLVENHRARTVLLHDHLKSNGFGF